MLVRWSLYSARFCRREEESERKREKEKQALVYISDISELQTSLCDCLLDIIDHLDILRSRKLGLEDACSSSSSCSSLH